MLKRDGDSGRVYFVIVPVVSTDRDGEGFSPFHAEKLSVAFDPPIEHRGKRIYDRSDRFEVVIDSEPDSCRSGQFIAPTQGQPPARSGTRDPHRSEGRIPIGQ